MFKIKVDKILSYQNGIKKGRYSYTTPKYKSFQQQIYLQTPMLNLDKKSPKMVNLEVFFKIPVNTSKKEKELKYGAFCDKKIDVDNLAKGIIDVIFNKNQIDDKKIVKLTITKKYITDRMDEKSEYIYIDIKNI